MVPETILPNAKSGFLKRTLSSLKRSSLGDANKPNDPFADEHSSLCADRDKRASLGMADLYGYHQRVPAAFHLQLVHLDGFDARVGPKWCLCCNQSTLPMLAP